MLFGTFGTCLAPDCSEHLATVRCPTYNVQRTMSNIECPTYAVQRTMSNIRCPKYDVQRTMSNIRCPPYDVHRTMSTVLCPTYDVQRTMSSELVSPACTAERPAVSKHSWNSLNLCGCPPACLASLRAGKQPQLEKSARGRHVKSLW